MHSFYLHFQLYLMQSQFTINVSLLLKLNVHIFFFFSRRAKNWTIGYMNYLVALESTIFPSNNVIYIKILLHCPNLRAHHF